MTCPHCHNDDDRMIETIKTKNLIHYLCNVCGKDWIVEKEKKK